MRLHRFLGNFVFKEKLCEITEGEVVNQIKNVLRLKRGGRLILISEETERECLIESVEKQSVRVREIQIVRIVNRVEAGRKSHLYCAILKKENFEFVVQKVTELGVSRITPLITERTIKTGLNETRLNRIAKEATEQSGRLEIPTIGKPQKLEDVISTVSGKVLVFDQRGKPGLSKILNKKSEKKVSFFIGPEGGWTEQELESFKNENFEIFSLGDTTLRAETAAIVATFALNNETC